MTLVVSAATLFHRASVSGALRSDPLRRARLSGLAQSCRNDQLELIKRDPVELGIFPSFDFDSTSLLDDEQVDKVYALASEA